MNFKKPIFLWALASLITTGGAFAQVKRKPTPSPRKKPISAARQIKPESFPVDPNIITGKLPNGLTYYIRNNHVPKNTAELLLVNKVGSVLETDAQRGMANFIGNMALGGSRDFPKSAMADYLQKHHIKFRADSNVYTSYDETVYRISVPTDTVQVFEKGFNILANWAGHLTFNDPAAISSVQVSLAEAAHLGGRNAKERLQQQTLPVLLNNSRYALRPPIGKEEAIKSFTAASVKSFYTDWYRPDLQAIIAVGDFDPKQVEALIKANFSALKNPAPEKPRTQYTVAPTPGTVVKYATDKEFPYTLAQIIVKHPQAGVKTPADFLQHVRTGLFNQMLYSRIAEVSQQANSPFLLGQASYGDFLGKQDAFTTLVIAKPGEFETGVKAIAAETERIRKFGFTSTELERAKQLALKEVENVYNLKEYTPSINFPGQYERNFLSGFAIFNIDYEYNYYINNIGKISLEDMNAVAQRFITDQNRVILIEGPESEKDKLPNEQTVLQWLSDAGKGLTQYIDNASIPLMTAAPVPGKVVNSKTDSTILVTNLTLSNGVKVILKPTQFSNNQILINGYGFGGTSLASDQDFVSANLASDVIGNSGVANFNQDQLSKMLREKNVSIIPYIGDISQGLSGYATGADFETAMQLIYLYFTQPRKDADAWKANLDKNKTFMVYSNIGPMSVFKDTVAAVLNNYNPRGLTLTLDKLNTASLDKAYSFYKDRFADAANFTFTFTGNFTVKDITPFLTIYLGSLPSTHKNETYKNLGIHPPAGQITKTVRKGSGDKAAVQLVYSGAYDYNEANNVQMDALEAVLDIKLLNNRLTEENGASSAGVRVNYVKIPEGRYKITISFNCDPANVDKLIANTVEEINKIRLNGADQKEIQAFIIQEARTTQEQLRQNAYWGASLSAAAQNQENPDRIISHVQDLEQITIPSTKETANKYLSGTNFIKFIFLPETNK